MEEENGLVAGRVYETVIGVHKVGRALYLGTKRIRRGKYRDVITFRDEYIVELWKFENHSFRNGKLEITIAVKDSLSGSEVQYLDERLKKAGI